jgi:hypothetical protein
MHCNTHTVVVSLLYRNCAEFSRVAYSCLSMVKISPPYGEKLTAESQLTRREDNIDCLHSSVFYEIFCRNVRLRLYCSDSLAISTETQGLTHGIIKTRWGQRSPKLISMILYQFLGIFDIIISIFWAVILGDIISK